MAIITEEVQEIRGGFAKGIEASAVNMILDNQQKYQYQYPLKSTIREIASNGVDTIIDKKSALDIIVNGAPVSKYYEERQGDLFKDSKFDPYYYDPKWLSTDDYVYITYQEGSGMDKDMLVIEDFGAGLGGTRLEKFFRLGFSTKRLSRQPLGKFGSGAKSPLSTGVDFYTVESRYNGHKYRFNVYSNWVESIIPRINTQTWKENDYILFREENDYKVYYEETDEKNGVSVMIAAKKCHKQQYVDAVKSQLLYFKEIILRVVKDGRTDVIPYQATIFYEDENIILSNNTMWSKPHLLLNNVNYGYINWDELELEHKTGNIGIKVDSANVDIGQSREHVIWSEKTKATILGQYNKVVDIATTMVQKELNETDFVRWMRVCYQISSRHWGDANSIVHRLAGIIDISQVKPVFPGNRTVGFGPSLFKGFSVRLYQFTQARNTTDKYKVIRNEVYMYNYSHLPLVLIDENTSVRKDKYLLRMVYPDGFIGIKLPMWMDEEWEYSSAVLEKAGIEGHSEFVRIKKKIATIYELLQQSSEAISYDDVEVPDSFVCSEEDEEELTDEDKKEAEEAKLTSEERRKVEGKTVYHTLRNDFSHDDKYYWVPDFTWEKAEIRIKDINQWTDRETFYGNDADIDSLQFAGFLSNNLRDKEDYNGIQERWRDVRDRKDIRFLKVAQANNKYYRDFKHINRFFLNVKNNVIGMSNVLVKWNTARLMLKEMPRLSFLYNFSAFSQDRFLEYHKLCEYMKDNYSEVYRNTRDTSAYEGLVEHLDKVKNFQLFVTTDPNSDQIAAMAKELFGNPDITDGGAIEMSVWKTFRELVEYADAVGPMLNEMPVLTGQEAGDSYEIHTERETRTICEEVEQSIHAFLAWKEVV